MKRILVSATAIAIASLILSSASAGCHHHRRAVQLIWVPAPAPVYQAPAFQQFQTIGGPGPTTVHDSTPVYGQPITEVAAPVVQVAPVQVVQQVAAPVATEAEPITESIPVGDSHPVAEIEEGPISADPVVAVEAAPEYAAPAPCVEAAAPVEYVAPAPAPAAPVFVETPPANRANIIETYYAPQMMYFQPSPVFIMQAPTRGCRHCRHR